MSLTEREINIINMLFDNMFSIEDKKEILSKADSSFSIDFALNDIDNQQVYNIFDNAFKLEHKIECVIALYSAHGFTFKDIHELIANRNVLLFNYYDSNWRNKGKSRFKFLLLSCDNRI